MQIIKFLTLLMVFGIAKGRYVTLESPTIHTVQAVSVQNPPVHTVHAVPAVHTVPQHESYYRISPEVVVHEVPATLQTIPATIAEIQTSPTIQSYYRAAEAIPSERQEAINLVEKIINELSMLIATSTDPMEIQMAQFVLQGFVTLLEQIKSGAFDLKALAHPTQQSYYRLAPIPYEALHPQQSPVVVVVQQPSVAVVSSGNRVVDPAYTYTVQPAYTAENTQQPLVAAIVA